MRIVSLRVKRWDLGFNWLFFLFFFGWKIVRIIFMVIFSFFEYKDFFFKDLKVIVFLDFVDSDNI